MGRMKAEFHRQREDAQSSRRRYGSADLTDAAVALGGDVVDEMIHCPSPGAPPEDRSLWVRVSPNNQVFIYSCDGPLGRAYAWVRGRLGGESATENATAFAITIWNETTTASGSSVEKYLHSRALTLPIPPDLRFHGALKHGPSGGSYWPAMVAARRRTDGTLTAIHRTYLQIDGRGKAPVDPQRMTSAPRKGPRSGSRRSPPSWSWARVSRPR